MPIAHLAIREQSQLVIVDVQEKLAAAMAEDAIASLARNCGILLQAAGLLEIPVIYTEQYPKGLGSTLAEFSPWLEKAARVEKTAFSCHAVPAFRSQLTRDRPQLVLAGMEAHICVLQTALQLQQHGHQVIVAEDAVLSRHPANKANALQRLQQAGVVVSNTESIVFEWLEKAEGDAFKAISRLVK
ncbi:isochorismatase family protein [Methylobacillus arboreus]|uniref:isochorismatase family protein n=1 Tax=Methylobacillus arboreus TaxID=755170 RepID=UPI001E484E9D|nr:isochorismatase family protein [Methylobacillus arboreus]MCB5190763.1 isochorismatase family protein [Methylobacillus arboreus]